MVSVASYPGPGHFVRKGDVLLQVDPADYAVQIRIATGTNLGEKGCPRKNWAVQQARQDWAKVGWEGRPGTCITRASNWQRLAKVEAAEAQLELARLNGVHADQSPFDGLVLEASSCRAGDFGELGSGSLG